MKLISSNTISLVGKIVVLTTLAVGGVLATTSVEARNRVSFSIGIQGGYGGLYWNGGGHRHYGYRGGYGYGGYGGYGYGYGGGYYGPGAYFPYYGPSVNVVLPPLIISSLPYGYRKVWVEGNPYYYADDVFYERVSSGYQVVPRPSNEVMIDEDTTDARPAPQVQSAPLSSNSSRPVPSYAQQAPAATADSNKLYAYPRNGQNPTQATFDRIECERWASGQTGFNPAQSSEDAQRRSEYQRATSACLDGRGYTVK